LINSHQSCFPRWFRSKYGWGQEITGGCHGRGQRLVFGCGCLMPEVEQDIWDFLHQQPVHRVPVAPCTLYETSSGAQKAPDEYLFKYLSQILGGHYLVPYLIWCAMLCWPTRLEGNPSSWQGISFRPTRYVYLVGRKEDVEFFLSLVYSSLKSPSFLLIFFSLFLSWVILNWTEL
jgi:hypothetical protein